MGLPVCGIVATSLLIFLTGSCFLIAAFYGVLTLSEVFFNAYPGKIMLAFLPLMWTFVVGHSLLIALTGFIGLVASCQRGQCMILTYMVFCVMTCVSCTGLLIVSAYYMITYCQLFECKDKAGQPLFLGLAGFVGIMSFLAVLSLLGSVISCSSKCECCGSQRSETWDQPESHCMITGIPATAAVTPM